MHGRQSWSTSWLAGALGALAALGVAVAACSGGEPTASDATSSVDAGSVDAGADGRTDAGLDGGGGIDAGARDAGRRDAGTDVGEPDAGGPMVCGVASPRFAGELCGPGTTRACAILVNERFDPFRGHRYTPALAVDSTDTPYVLWAYGRGLRSDAGRLSTRTATGWTTNPTLFDLTDGALVVDATDTPIALASDMLNVDHYERRAADWTLVDRLPIDQDVDARTMQRDEGGCLYALGAAGSGPTGVEPTALLVRDSTWHVTPLGSGVQSRSAALALAPSGEAHVVWSEIVAGASYRLYWTHGGAPAELAWAGGDGDPLGFDASTAVTATPSGDEIPHVLFAAPSPAGDDELRYATRAADGSWSVVVLDTGRARGCSAPPAATGESCPIDGLYLVPIAVVASGSGDVRLFWVRIAETGALTGRCGAPGPVDCVWDEMTTRDARLVVGAPGEPMAEVGTGLDLESATAVLDSTGHIQLAASDIAAGLRYLVIGPATP